MLGLELNHVSKRGHSKRIMKNGLNRSPPNYIKIQQKQHDDYDAWNMLKVSSHIASDIFDQCDSFHLLEENVLKINNSRLNPHV